MDTNDLKKRLNKIRDEKAKEFHNRQFEIAKSISKETLANIGNALGGQKGYKSGFDACAAELLPLLESAVEVLRYIRAEERRRSQESESYFPSSYFQKSNEALEKLK